jgi:hypothetical protein
MQEAALGCQRQAWREQTFVSSRFEPSFVVIFWGKTGVMIFTSGDPIPSHAEVRVLQAELERLIAAYIVDRTSGASPPERWSC